MELVPPYDWNHTQILQLFHPFTESSKAYAVESYSKVFLCGDATAGKSSLCELIKYRSDKSSDHEYDPSYRVTVTPLTAGIEVHTITSLEIGHVVMYDFAGHREYYSSHNAVLENLMLRSPAVFVVVNKLTESEDVIEKNLYYWLNFIENVNTKLSKQSQVIIVGSHVDKLQFSDVTDIEQFIKQTVKHGIRGQIFKGYVALDCRSPGGKNVSLFTSLLSESCNDVIDRSDTISYYCHVLYSFLNDLKKAAIQIDELCTKLQEHDHPSLPYDVSVVTEFLTTLSDKGLILFLPSKGWIVIDKAALFTEVNGVLFAPSSIKRVHRDIASNTGIITLTALKDTFPHHDIDMLVGFLKSLEFCHVINTDILNSISTNISPSTPIASGELLFFPSLVTSNSPAVMSNDPKFGYCLWCPKRHEFLSNRFLHVLLLHLPLRYCLDYDCAGLLEKYNQKYNRLCNVWHNGILWQNDELEVLVQVSELNRCVTLLMSHKDGFEAHQISCSLLCEIHLLRNKCCPCHIAEYIIVPSKLTKDTHLVPVSERSLIRLENLARAVLQKEDKVIDTKGKSVFIADIVSDQEVYYCLPSNIIYELFTDDHVDEEVYDTIKGACKDIMKEYSREDPVSSLSVRNHLNKYSLFSCCELKVHVSIVTMLVS